MERQIVSGVAEYFDSPEALIGKKIPVLMNLEPRKIMGYESQGMILYVSDGKDLTKNLLPELWKIRIY